jgi:hypothetical protein
MMMMDGSVAYVLGRISSRALNVQCMLYVQCMLQLYIAVCADEHGCKRGLLDTGMPQWPRVIQLQSWRC